MDHHCEGMRWKEANNGSDTDLRYGNGDLGEVKKESLALHPSQVLPPPSTTKLLFIKVRASLHNHLLPLPVLPMTASLAVQQLSVQTLCPNLWGHCCTVLGWTPSFRGKSAPFCSCPFILLALSTSLGMSGSVGQVWGWARLCCVTGVGQGCACRGRVSKLFYNHSGTDWGISESW